MQAAIRIIGIDPGLRRTGWGVVEAQGNALRFVASGTVRSDDKADLAIRLHHAPSRAPEAGIDADYPNRRLHRVILSVGATIASDM